VARRRDLRNFAGWCRKFRTAISVFSAYTMGIQITPENGDSTYDCLLTTTFQSDGRRAGWDSYSAASTLSCA